MPMHNAPAPGAETTSALGTLVAARKPLPMATARRAAHGGRGPERAENAAAGQAAAAPGGGAAAAAPGAASVAAAAATHADSAHARARDSAQPRDRRSQADKGVYANELDCDFFGTAFETYQVSKRSKRAGGGREIGAASAWCGNLTLHIPHCNWIQKICYGGTGSTRKFCADSLLYLASRDGFFNRVFHHKYGRGHGRGRGRGRVHACCMHSRATLTARMRPVPARAKHDAEHFSKTPAPQVRS